MEKAALSHELTINIIPPRGATTNDQPFAEPVDEVKIFQNRFSTIPDLSDTSNILYLAKPPTSSCWMMIGSSPVSSFLLSKRSYALNSFSSNAFTSSCLNSEHTNRHTNFTSPDTVARSMLPRMWYHRAASKTRQKPAPRQQAFPLAPSITSYARTV